MAAGPGPMNSNSPYRYLWIGLSDAAVEGTFKWNSTGQVTTNSFWLSGQPDNSYYEDFTIIESLEDGHWGDVAGSFTGAATMCEKTITPTLSGKK